MKIISYNVNGIRAAIKKGFWDWMKENQYDIVCVQETKAHPEQLDLQPLEDMGYHYDFVSAEKRGYSGVATFSKAEPDKVVHSSGLEEFDKEGRILRSDFDGVTLLNIYFPSGTTGDVRQEVKYRFLDGIFDWVHDLRKEREKIILVGDYNIAHTEIDIHSPKTNKKTSGFLPEERAWMTKWFDSGFIDSFRHLNPDFQQYSWWSFRANARANNKGWRIDYQSVTENMKDKLRAAYHLNDVHHSDHCPVYLEIDV